MTISSQDRELFRTRWRRSHADSALDSTSREDFALGALARRLSEVTVQVVLLPGDPEASNFAINESTHEWLSGMSVIELDEMSLRLPDEVRRSADALVLVRRYNDDSWSSYLAIHRSGAIEWGLGDEGGWNRADRDGSPIRCIFLSPIVARTWAVLRLAATMQTDHDVCGPFQLVVAIRDSKGAHLGRLAEGWAEPGSFENHVRPCVEQHLLWRIELDEIPGEVEAKMVAYAIGDRIEDAWGVPQRRYLAHRGQYVGHLDPRKF